MHRPKLGLVALALLPTLAACSAAQSDPVPYPAEDGAYYQIYEQDGATVLQVARVSNGKTVTVQGELPAGASLGSPTVPVRVSLGTCGPYNVINATHASANPLGQDEHRLMLVEAVAGGSGNCEITPMPSSVLRVGA